MPDRLTIDVIDRPAEGLRRSVQRIRAIRSGTPGLRAILACGTGNFVARVRPSPTPRRIAVLAAWDDDDGVDDRWAESLGALCGGAREHWHVEAEVVRAAFSAPWKGWTPDATGARPLDDDEPALILVSGDLRARYLPAFAKDLVGAVGHAFEQPGYLGGLGINSSPLNTTSCSCWRSYRDAREYAFRPGAHAQAMKRDRTEEHHKTEHFLRLRPLAERGSLAGAAPFGELLARPAAAA